MNIYKKSIIVIMVFLMVVVLASCEEQLPNENFNNIPSKATQSQQSSYLGKWEAVSMESEPSSITITEDKVYIRSKTESGNFTTTGPFSYVISSDNHYVYLDIINPFEILISSSSLLCLVLFL